MSTRAWIVWIALLFPLAALAAGTACGGSEKGAARDEASEHAGEEHADAEPEAHDEAGTLTMDAETLRDLKLTTFPAELRPGGEGVTALGELKVDENLYAEVGSPIPARVVRLIASPGQPVRRGQALAELQSVEVGHARAQRTAAEAREELARKTVERKRGLAAERIVSQGDLQRAEAEAAEAEAELRAAEASLAALGVGGGGGDGGGAGGGGLSTFTLPSPISGTVLERLAVRGRSIEPSEPLFRIGDLSRLWLVVQAPERDVVRMRAGSPAEITLAALPGQKLRGTVEWLGREVDAHSRTVPVRIVLPNEGQRLRPGMFATAWIETSLPGRQGEQVVAVPATALQRMDDQWVVFLPRGEGRFEVRTVERGRDLGNEVAILSGLKPGELVVDEGAFTLRAEGEKQEGGGEHHH